MRLVLDETGAVLDEGGDILNPIAYDAFGNIVARLNPLLANPILFTSREFDFETGLYHNRARYLDPTTGRWTTQDPLGFAAGDANMYRYVGNMATMATDPSGNLIFVPVLVVGGAALAVAGIADCTTRPIAMTMPASIIFPGRFPSGRRSCKRSSATMSGRRTGLPQVVRWPAGPASAWWPQAQYPGCACGRRSHH